MKIFLKFEYGKIFDWIDNDKYATLSPPPKSGRGENSNLINAWQNYELSCNMPKA